MTDIAKVGTPSLSSINPPQPNIMTGLLAGEDGIEAGDACYIKPSDGKIWRSVAGGTDDEAQVVGFALFDADEDDHLEIAEDVTFEYGSGLTPGAQVFLSTNAGAICPIGDMDASAWMPIGRCLTATRIRLWRSYWPAGSSDPT